MADFMKILGAGENESLEFKPAFNQDVIETASAFANTRGGRIVIGVDNSGKALGTCFGNEVLRDFVNRIANATDPTVIPDAEMMNSDHGDVVLMRIPEYPLKPIAVRGRCFKRSGSTTRQMTSGEIAEVHLQCTGQSADALMVDGKTVEDLELEQVRRYMTRAVNSGRRSFSENDDPTDILKKLELIDKTGNATRAAILLFGRNPQSPLSQSVIHAGRLEGTSRILDDRIIRGTLVDQVEEALVFIRKHINVEYVISGKAERDEVWDYPLTALREGLMNAVCHRDYGDLADIQIKIFDDALQIWSPGFLPFGMTEAELLEPNHSSKPRNRLISQIFYDMGLIEQYGSGIGRVRDACANGGLPDPEFGNYSGGFRVLFMSTTEKTKMKAQSWLESELESELDSELESGVQRTLAVLKNSELAKLEIAHAMGLKQASGTLHQRIREMLDDGLIEYTIPERPNSRLQKYRLTEKGKALLVHER